MVRNEVLRVDFAYSHYVLERLWLYRLLFYIFVNRYFYFFLITDSEYLDRLRRYAEQGRNVVYFLWSLCFIVAMHAAANLITSTTLSANVHHIECLILRFVTSKALWSVYHFALFVKEGPIIWNIRCHPHFAILQSIRCYLLLWVLDVFDWNSPVKVARSNRRYILDI